MALKAGVKSSEFWVVLLVVCPALTGLILELSQAGVVSEKAVWFQGILAFLGAVYTFARTMLKKNGEG